jgi:SRSO17 transposase
MKSQSDPLKKRFCFDKYFGRFNSIAQLFVEFHDMYRSFFQTATGNVAPRGRDYLAGLLMKAPRKNMERMEEYVAQSDYQAMQQFLTDSPWNDHLLQQQISRDVSAIIGGDDAVLAIDESAFGKKGTMSAGVSRQWNGRLGKTDNCQVGVFSSLISGNQGSIIGKRLFLPENWTSDEKRCEKAGIPKDNRTFKKKTELAVELIDDAISSGVKFGYICGDGFYGHTPEFVRAVHSRGLIFMLDVHKNQHVYMENPNPVLYKKAKKDDTTSQVLKTSISSVKVENIAKSIDNSEWEIHTIRESTKGMLSLKVWRKQVFLWDGKEGKAHQWWLVITRNENDSDTKYFISNAPESDQAQKIVRIHSQRFWIERCFQDAKTSVGMADYQARKWNSWHHHMCMVSLAMLFVLSVKKANNGELDCSLSYNDIVELLNVFLPREDITKESVVRNIIRRHRKRCESEESAYLAQLKKSKRESSDKLTK